MSEMIVSEIFSLAECISLKFVFTYFVIKKKMNPAVFRKNLENIQIKLEECKAQQKRLIKSGRNTPKEKEDILKNLGDYAKILSPFERAKTMTSFYHEGFDLIQKHFCGNLFLYTDASVECCISTYSITKEKEIIKTARLPNYSSPYETELQAVKEAIHLNVSNRRTIVTDSLSVVNVLVGYGCPDKKIQEIQNLLIKQYPRITLLWVPGHIGIQGNALADSAARNERMKYF